MCGWYFSEFPPIAFFQTKRREDGIIRNMPSQLLLKSEQPAAFDEWWKDTVFYELYVDKFAGNFPCLAEKINYLAELGIGCIHVLPHYPSPMADDGYDISDYKNIRAGLGTMEDFDLFVKRAHEAGIRVMIDFVLNHVSIQHPWFKEGM